MKYALLILPLVSASWFTGSDPSPPYTSWSNVELKEWLHDHNLPTPAESRDELIATVEKNWNSASTWSQNQYNNAQKTFASIRDDTFEAWDESTLRSWLLEQGVVAPKDNKEQLVLLAKQRYKSYQSAAQRWSDWASGNAQYATDTVVSYAAAATKEAERVMDDSKDYIYSTWDDNKLRSFLEEKGIIKTKSQKKREELLTLMRDNYAKAADPVWDAWSTSYMHNWLLTHNLVSPTPSPTEKARKALADKMNQFYYTTNSYVWDTWSDSTIRQWLVDNGVVKSEVQLSRDKMLKMISDTYTSTASTVLSIWSTSKIRSWLIDHDYMTTSEAAKANRSQLIKIAREKWVQTKEPVEKSVAPYHYSFVTWPDPRLRAYLYESGVKPKAIPATREGLLEKMGEVWEKGSLAGTRYYERTKEGAYESFDSGKGESEALFERIKNIVNEATDAAEDKVVKVWSVLSGYYSGTKKEREGQKEKEKAQKMWGEL